jgi:hypothetical protein
MAGGIKPAYIYVLHFETKLSHAEHYVGCTHELQNRLRAHAFGYGSRLTEVLRERGIEWKLAALGSTSHSGMRRVERKLKNQHNAKRYCTICSGKASLRIPSTTPYPFEALSFPTDSATIRQIAKELPIPEISWCEESDQESLARILRLMSDDRDALGFIPCGGNEGIVELAKKQQLIIAKLGRMCVGYTAITLSNNGEWANIQQCCVADAFRTMGIGRRMVELATDTWPGRNFRAVCRDDLAANHFWESIGFTLTDSKRHKTSKSILNIWERENARYDLDTPLNLDVEGETDDGPRSLPSVPDDAGHDDEPGDSSSSGEVDQPPF